MPIVTQLSQSSDDDVEEQQIDAVQHNAAAAASSAPAASSTHKSSTSNTTTTPLTTVASSLPPRPRKALVQSGLFGFKVVQASKMVSVRQFKKKTGSKVRSHSRKQSSSCHSVPRACRQAHTLASHIDPESAKTIQSLLIQDKFDQCKARIASKSNSKSSDP